MAGGEGPLPHYYVFDLDETLGQMHSFFYQMCTLRPEEFYRNAKPNTANLIRANDESAALKARLTAAYATFVRLIAEQELSDSPLGLLRPGILEVFRAIQAQKERGQPVCAIIYSNNGSLHLLELTRDVIHEALGVEELIRDCVHWYNPMRKPEIEPSRPGSAAKTWPVLRRLLSEGPCGASPDVEPHQITFFDDKVHPNLKSALRDDSIQVLPFTYKATTSRVNDLYTAALRGAGFFDSEEETQRLLAYIHKHCRTAKSTKAAPLTWAGHLAVLEKGNGVTAPLGKVPPLRMADTDTLVAAIRKYDVASSANRNNPLSNVSSNLFTGGKGRIARRRVVTRRKRSKHAAKKSRHIRRRR